MPNIAAVLKEEICRLARREVKRQVGKTQKAAVQYRRDIAKLKRQLSGQEKELIRLKRKSSSAKANRRRPKSHWRESAFRRGR